LWRSWLANGWLQPESQTTTLGMAATGVILALAIYTFGFSTFANRNIHRINQYSGKLVCIFAFQSWTSYPLVAFMISLGIYLRTSSIIPKPYLAAMYFGIGGSLFLASMHYYRFLFVNSNRFKPNQS